MGHLRKPPGVELIPAVKSHLGVRAPYETRRKRRYEANKCGWTQPLFRKALDRGVNGTATKRSITQRLCHLT